MKKISRTSLSLFLLFSLVLLFACAPASAVWDGALYRDDTTVGTGKNAYILKVSAENKSVTLTVLSDEETPVCAFRAAGLIGGEDGAYGLYVKTVNGIRADYDADGSFWGLYINGEMSMTGIDGVSHLAGNVYEFRMEK